MSEATIACTVTYTSGHKGAVWSSKLSLDASRAVTGSADFTAKIWDCNSGEALHTFSHGHIVRSVALSPQQQPQYLLTVGSFRITLNDY